MKRSIDFFGRMLEFAVKNPEVSPDRLLVINMRKETFDKILTPARMEIIRTIKKKNPKSVGSLAKLLKRPVEAVSRDLRILENYSILEFIRIGKIKKPKIEKEMILIPLNY